MYKFRWLFIITSITLLGSIAMFKQNVAAGDNSKGEILGSPLVFDWFGESPTSDKILFSVLSDRLTLYLSSPKENWETKITDDLGWAAWSPVGDQFIYWTSNGQLFFTDATTGNTSPKLLAQEVTAASFAPHGQSLIILRTDFDSKQPGIYLYNLATQKEELLTQEIASGIGIRGYAPLWSPDGHYLLFLRSARQGEPYPFSILDLEEKQVYPLQSGETLPIPASPLYLASNGVQFAYGTESMDAPSVTWAITFDFKEGEVNEVQQNSGYWPVGVNETGEIVLESAQPQEIVDASLSEIFVPSILAPDNSLYSVKYKQPVAGSITSFFSHSNTDPFADGTYNYFCTNRYRAGHKGTDFGAGNGTSIKAGATGVVEVAKNNCEPHDNTCPNQMGDQCNGGFGNYVRVRHSNNARTYYAHMKSTSVTANQTVYTYTTLGLVGSSGNSSGCHLHFEIRYPDINASSAVDPFYGPCNWITQSLWNGPQPIGMDE